MIPSDPFMLLSFINMKLRDGEYKDLADLCQEIDCNPEEIIKILRNSGFEYMPEIRQFR
ncbi:MAG: DUF4250 domain-containing protein [Muribaculaceae bacterium]|nr:DUF4250 domain-containing protein [Muribaculaceae bacterium]